MKRSVFLWPLVLQHTTVLLPYLERGQFCRTFKAVALGVVAGGSLRGQLDTAYH